jgi:hypothetical protein
VYDLPEEYWHTYRSRLESVTADDVLGAAQELVRPEEALILLTGDAAKVAGELESAGLGPVEIVSPA